MRGTRTPAAKINQKEQPKKRPSLGSYFVVKIPRALATRVDRVAHGAFDRPWWPLPRVPRDFPCDG
jgi:hypothetical protein